MIHEDIFYDCPHCDDPKCAYPQADCETMMRLEREKQVMMWQKSELYDGCHWYRLDIPGIALAIHIGRWRNHDDRAEWNSWTANIAGYDNRLFWSPDTDIETVKKETRELLATRLEALAEHLRVDAIPETTEAD